MTTAANFWGRVDQSGDCWLWIGSACKGYGTVRFDGRSRYAHQVAYEMTYGPVGAGLELDHLCRTPRCVRPEHLEPVTHRENVWRGVQARFTTCRRGHPRTPENRYFRPGSERKSHCIACVREAKETRR